MARMSTPSPQITLAVATRRPDGTGRLTIYVGAAAGVGKTYRMLQDANDWRRAGVDVVVGLVETHGRAETAAQIGSLEVLPLKEIVLQGRLYSELDVTGILRRKPAVVLIDELAHTNLPGSPRAKRYQDILYLLEQGINVVTAVNIQHLESLQDTVFHITGVRVRERVPDSFMDRADEIRFIDCAPETLQQRLLEGKIYAPEKVADALAHFFKLEALAALREIALLEVADQVERTGRHEGPAAARAEPERILVAVSGRPGSDKLVRRGWRIADRLHAALYVLMVVQDPNDPEWQTAASRMEALAHQFGATFLRREAGPEGVGPAIVAAARELAATQMVMGQPADPEGSGRKPDPVDYVLTHADFTDLYLVARDDAAPPGLTRSGNAAASRPGRFWLRRPSAS
jgi:two-component system sensor histidine kinase KdpD